MIGSIAAIGSRQYTTKRNMDSSTVFDPVVFTKIKATRSSNISSLILACEHEALCWGLGCEWLSAAKAGGGDDPPFPNPSLAAPTLVGETPKESLFRRHIRWSLLGKGQVAV